MKNLFKIFLLGFSITSLAGCTPANPDPGPGSDPVDENAVKKINFAGSMKKKDYKYDDEWDLTGLSVKATTNGGKTYTLDPSEYKIIFTRNAPRNYANSLQITAQYKADLLKTARVTYKDINVADEVYDNESEVEQYYSDCDKTLKGSSLMDELHRHSFAKHTTFVKYNDTQPILGKNSTKYDCETPDLVPGEHKIEMFYTNNKTDYQIGTREHVWACADSANLWPHGKVDSADYYGGGSDLYHIRPCDSDVNTARGDAPYVDFDHPDFISKKSKVIEIGDDGPYKLKIYNPRTEDGKYAYSELVEPADEVKGDIARIIAYVYMHYNSNTKTPSKYKSLTGALNLTKVLGFNTTSKAKEQLKKWNELDPVSPVETRRNHTVQQIQGNRNPFVDFPELINEVF